MFYTRNFLLASAVLCIVFFAKLPGLNYFSLFYSLIGTYLWVRGFDSHANRVADAKGSFIKSIRSVGYSDTITGGTLVGLGVVLQALLSIRTDLGW